MACEGYARYSGKISLCCVTSGPGGTNALTGVMGAYQDNIPMIVLSGQVRYDTTITECELPIRRRGEQEFDIVNSVQNMTKYAKMIINPLEIKQEVQKAIDIAMEGRRGPVWIDVPLNVQSAEVEENELLPILQAPEIIKCTEKEFEKVISMLKNAKRPCILAGSAILSSGLKNKLEDFLDIYQVPTVGAACVADALYNEHPFYFGSTGMIGSRSGNFIIQNADIILVLGSSLGFKQTGFAQENFATNAKIIMVDVDENEPKKPGLKVNTFVYCNLKYFLEKLISKNTKIKTKIDWLEYCNKLKTQFPVFGEIEKQTDDERVSAGEFWKKYYDLEPDDNITVLGNSSSVSGKLQYSAKTKKQRVLVNINCGSMGCDVPPAIGACIAAKKEVICFTGDGSLMMNLQELATIKHNKLPVKLIVFSNGGYGAIRQTCKNYFKGKDFGCSEDSGLSFPNFKQLAESFDIPYRLCENTGELEDSINWVFNQKSFVFLEVLQKFVNPTLPRLMSRLKEDGTFERPMLEDMYPFLGEEKIKSLMLN